MQPWIGVSTDSVSHLFRWSRMRIAYIWGSMLLCWTFFGIWGQEVNHVRVVFTEGEKKLHLLGIWSSQHHSPHNFLCTLHASCIYKRLLVLLNWYDTKRHTVLGCGILGAILFLRNLKVQLATVSKKWCCASKKFHKKSNKTFPRSRNFLLVKGMSIVLFSL